MLWISRLGLLPLCPTDFGLLCPHFHLFQGVFWFLPCSHWWPINYLINMLFSFHVLMCISVFLWLISSFIALWSGKMLDMISILLNLLRYCKFILCPTTWYVLEKVPCALENYVYSAALGWNALKIAIKSIRFSVSFKAVISLLISCLEHLSIELNGVLKSPNMTVFLSISPFMFIKICFTYLGAPMLRV